MLIKVLGAIDLIAGSVLIFLGVKIPVLFGILGGILILKSLICFLKDFGSWIDLLAGLTFLISISLSVPLIIKIIIGILILQKGAMSFL